MTTCGTASPGEKEAAFEEEKVVESLPIDADISKKLQKKRKKTGGKSKAGTEKSDAQDPPY